MSNNRKIFLTGLLICTASFVFAPSQTQEAHAQKGVFMTPKGPWNVNQVGDAANLQDAYCAIAKVYDEKTILTFARNTDNETSFAVDFQANRLNPSNTVRMTLDPGAAQLRSFEVTPASEKAVVARLGDDGKFFSALRRTGFLRAEIGQENFNFNISDFDAGEALLSECITSLLQPISPIAAAPVPAAPTGEISSLQSEIKSLKEETRRLSNILAGGEKSVTAEISEDVTIREMAEKLDDAQAEKEVLKSELARLRALSLETDTSTDQRLAALQEDNKRLRNTLIGLETLIDEKEQEVTRLETVINEKQTLTFQMHEKQQGWSQTMEDARQKIIDLEGQNKTLNDRLAGIEAQKAAEISELNKELSAMNLLSASLQEQVDTLQEDKAAQKTEYEQVVQKLNVQISGLRRTIEEKNKDLERMAMLSEELQMVSAEKTSLEEKIGQEVSKQEVADADVRALEQELQKSLRENDALQNELAEAIAKSEKTQKDETPLVQDIAPSVAVPVAQKPVKEQKNTAQKLAKKGEELRPEDLLQAPIETEQAKAKRSAAPEAVQETKTVQKRSRDLTQQAVQNSMNEAQAREQALKDVLADGSTAEKIKRQMQAKEQKSKAAQELAQKEQALKDDIAREAAMIEAEKKMEEAISTKDLAAQEAEIENMLKNKPQKQDEVVLWNQDERVFKEDEQLARKSPPVAAIPKVKPQREKQAVIETAKTEAPTPQDQQPVARAVKDAIQDLEAVPDPVERAPIKAMYQPSFEIKKLISKAEIATPENVKYEEQYSNTSNAAYQWRVSNVYGSAELRPFEDNEDFDIAVKEYLEKTQSRCDGDFAILPDGSKQMGQTRLDSYDVACVGGKADSSAALLFFNKAGTFTALAHEAPLSDLDATISLRERVKHALSQSS